ncbi:MAG: type II toxin-antitoxin system RelE/ParE family toxin [Tannerellaceae bacterium]
MKKKFDVVYSEEVEEFLKQLDVKVRQKILTNIEKSQTITDSELFAKLTANIWEFRTIYKKQKYRLLAFWDKQDGKETLVIVTHGFIKKTQKTPAGEIKKAEQIRDLYFS